MDVKADLCSTAKQFSLRQWLIDPFSKGGELLEHFMDFSQSSRMPHGLCCNNLRSVLSETAAVSQGYANRALQADAGCSLQAHGTPGSSMAFRAVTL